MEGAEPGRLISPNQNQDNKADQGGVEVRIDQSPALPDQKSVESTGDHNPAGPGDANSLSSPPAPAGSEQSESLALKKAKEAQGPTPTPGNDTFLPGVEPSPRQQFGQEDYFSALPRQTSTQSDTEITWTASEFVHHAKSANWYLGLAIATILIGVVVYFFTHGDKMTIGVLVIVALAFGFSAGKKPRELQYRLDDSGLTIGPKFYSYNDFKSFSIFDEGQFSSISLLPLKRFLPTISIYYPPEDGEKIINMLSERMPVDTRTPDLTDRFLRKVRY